MCSTVEAANKIGVCKNTLLRWINEGLIPDVDRDWRGWRVWSDDDVARAAAFKTRYHAHPIPRLRRQPLRKATYASAFAESMSQYAEARQRRAEVSS